MRIFDGYRRSGVVAAALAVVGGLTLSACGGGAAVGAYQSEGEIDRSATLRVSSAAPSRNLDPYLQATSGGLGHLTPVYDRLIMANENDELVPGLATEWQYAPDGSSLEMTLREGVKFHDGAVFDANAVAANIARGQTMPGSTVVDALRSINQVEVVDSTHVRLQLVPGTGADLPGRFTTNAGMMISPAAISSGADIRNGPGDAGSGPYEVSSYVPEESLVLTRVQGDYWDPEAGGVAAIEITTIADAATRLNGVRTGATDLTWVSSPSEIVDARNVAAQGILNVEEVRFRGILGVLMRSRGDLSAPEVRQAVAHAINPEAINALFSGTCTPFQQIEPQGSWAAADSSYRYPYSYDQAAARALLAEAGPASVTLTFAASSNTDKPANVIQSMLEDVGIDAELSPLPGSQADLRYTAGDFESSVSNSVTPKLDPAETVEQYITGKYNFANDNPEIIELTRQAADPARNEADRAVLYREIWEKTLEEALFVPLCQLTNMTVSSPKVQGADSIPRVNSALFDVRHVSMTN